MKIYHSSAKELAEFLVTSPWYYSHAKSFLVFDKFLNSKLNIAEATRVLEEANRIARESDHFVLDVYDSWAEEAYGEGSGQRIFQNIEGNLVVKLGLRDGCPPDIENILSFLKDKKVKAVYTFDPYEETSFGLETEEKSLFDNHIIQNSILGLGEKNYLESEGIEVVVL